MGVLKKDEMFFSINVNSALFGISLRKKLFQFLRNICFEAIQNGGKSNSTPGLNRSLSSNL